MTFCAPHYRHHDRCKGETKDLATEPATRNDILGLYIREFSEEKKKFRPAGWPPPTAKICDHFGFSSYGTVYKHLSLLEKKGLIRRDWNQKRGVELVEREEKAKEAPGVRELPLFGYIAAGRPLDVEVSDETIAVPEHLTTRGETILCSGRGDS